MKDPYKKKDEELFKEVLKVKMVMTAVAREFMSYQKSIFIRLSTTL